MSASPSPNATPPPPPGAGAGPSPQKIAMKFIQQYYKILLNSPSQLNRFYQADSTVSRGMEPAAPATPSAFNLASAPTNGSEDTPGERVRKAFFDWAGRGTEDTLNIMKMDFERGAIDAQESIGGGILIVVTGHITLPRTTIEKGFVHTFFLNNTAGPGKRKNFLVKNDILRFLDSAKVIVEEEPEIEIVQEEVVQQEQVLLEQEIAVVTAAAEVEVAAPVVVEEPVAVIEPPAVSIVEEPLLVSSPLVSPPVVPVEPVPIVPVDYEPSADEEKVEEPEEVEEPIVLLQPTDLAVDPAAEEEKIEATETSLAGSDTSPVVSPSSSSDGKKSKRNRKKRGGKSRSRSNSPRKEDAKEETPEKPKTPGSWASLVASGGGSKKTQDGGKKVERKSSTKAPRATADKSSNNQEAVAATKAPPQSQEPASNEPSPKEPAATTDSTAATPQQSSQPLLKQRTPEATLFIRNIPDKTQESEIRGLFEAQGASTGNKILGITLNPNRGFCFVDFDGSEAVSAIVNESVTSLVKDPRTGRKVTSSFMVHGRVLDVERKVQSDRNKQGGGGGGRRFNRSHSPKDGGGRYRGSRGGMRRSPPRGGGGSGGTRRD